MWPDDPGTSKGSDLAMSIADRLRRRRMINRENRAIDRAWMSAPTQSMRDEIALMAQRRNF
ncbi:hypothetical protein SAMN05421748_12572 [Paractinoplanes atraurantiacus]|uniref:Uncharacterized protein n=1 Tax=Paractinoplanes atraurantiacus TaxID=1036182 RepID=A0A285JWC6_9ACTN|nr:hypothetical protein SAMN05421748_12572 [Actinoplanes atraurantiacus]